MRLLRVCCTLAGPLALLAPSPASAADHLMRINEVGLTAAGNAGAQYVELRDPVMEPFLAGPYRVVVYNAAGARIGSVAVAGPFGTSPYLVSTVAADQIYGATADARLTVALPIPSGQVCFTRGVTEMKIHCLAYGTVAAPVSSEGGTGTGPSPPSCRSLERTSASSYVVAAPTPNAANDAASPAGACGPAVPGVDSTPPRQRLRLRRRRDVDRVILRVRLNEAADLTVSGFARIAGSSRRLRFATVRREVDANELTRVRLRLRRSRRVAVKNAIEDGKVVRARVRIEAEDARGNESVTTRRIRLTD